MAAPQLRDRLSFLHRLPILMKGTSDDDVPCPGYLFEEIAKISHESVGSSQCLLEYLLNRLQSNSCHVKLKALKILLYMCSHGSASFLLALKRNSSFIQEAAVFGGLPDPLHGNSLYQKVRVAAQDLASALFSDTLLPLPSTQSPRSLPATGMGSQSSSCSSLQGFGYTKDRGSSGFAGEALLTTIQKAAEVVANAVLPGHESPSMQSRVLREDTYQPVVAPAAGQGHFVPRKPPSGPTQSVRVKHQPGQAGGGWEEMDSDPSSQNSSQENGELSRASNSGSKSDSDSHSGTSREMGDVTERVEAVTLSDCLQEMSLVSTVTQGPRVFLTREEVQHFIKECGLLNCEAVLELLNRELGRPSECVQMRAMCAIFSLMCSDLLSQDHIFFIIQPKLQQLSEGSPGPVTNKATKILRHFEALCRNHPTHKKPASQANTGASRPSLCPTDLLTDVAPFAEGESFLQPVSSSSSLPRGTAPAASSQQEITPISARGDMVPGRSVEEAETRLAVSSEQEPDSSGTDTTNGRLKPDTNPESSLSSPATGTCSLFAGMELVAHTGVVVTETAKEELLQLASSSEAPWISSREATSHEAPSPKLSAFAFLNA
ncbi:AP-4 complex accessory subunit tepsin isoform X1 [Sarcophilus harrisii]|uniref:AP-4 complex accessory subunit Tepsin n=1 Tax=Sarcophilus harrisii TaxID=9305 RepID=G3WU34_SARHA|nr:AP-4 complex accessory subunit tepsin isoform X1 [Sarcophilus harrisii]